MRRELKRVMCKYLEYLCRVTSSLRSGDGVNRTYLHRSLQCRIAGSGG